MKKTGKKFNAQYTHGAAIVMPAIRKTIPAGLSLLFLIIFLICFSHPLNAQENSLPTGIRYSLAYQPGFMLSNDTIETADTTMSGVLPPETEPKLLPDNMSFGEKFLWGKNGLVHKLGLEPPLSPEERMSELHLRRGMLIAHQIGGFTTLALMLTADYFGQQVIDGHRNLGDTHQMFVAATIASYTATGLLAVLSPPPLIRRDEGSTTSLHKTLAWIHLIGMIVTPIIGSTIRHRRVFNMDQAHFHQVSGYLTTAVLATSMLVIVF